MKERPIIFSGPSVLAIQQNRKFQTRRIIRKPETYTRIRDCAYCCPYGDQGNRLWVREAFLLRPGLETISKPHYRADGEKSGWMWKSPLFMFRRDSRLLLEITEVRVQRRQEIDEADAQREGWAFEGLQPNQSYDPVVMDTARHWYRSEWDRLNAKRGFPWSANPWVWTISFKRITEAPHV